MEQERNNQQPKTPFAKRVLQFALGQGVGILVTGLMLVIMATTLCTKDYSHDLIPTLALVCLGVGGFFAGLVFAAICGKRGYLNGSIAGLVLGAVCVLLGVAISPQTASGLWLRLAIGLVSGLVGGVLGVNLRLPGRRRQ